MATIIFSVTAAMVKEGRLVTSLGDSIIEQVAQEKEYCVSTMTEYLTAPSDAATLSNLRTMVCLAAAIQIANMNPHSEGDGSYRYDYYPIAAWQKELSDLEDKYFVKTDTAPVIYEQPID